MIKKIVKYLKEDYNRKTIIFALLSTLICLTYAIYNGYLGITKLSLFHGSICVYYLLLLGIRTMLLVSERRPKNGSNHQKPVIILSYTLLLLITVAMITPIMQLINDKREYNLGLIPAIATAAYTTYSITMAIINMKKAKTNDNAYVKQIRLLNLIYSIMSVTVLQSTMILANGGYDGKMRTLSIYTSFAIISIVAIIVIHSFISYIKELKVKK